IAATNVLPLEPEPLAPVATDDSEAGIATNPTVTWPAVSSEYLAAMGIELRKGQFFREGEADAVAVVSESAARILWPGQDPIGQRLSRPEVPRKWLRVICIVGDVLSRGLDHAPTPAIYRPFSQHPTLTFRVVAQTNALAGAFNETLRNLVNRIDAD